MNSLATAREKEREHLLKALADFANTGDGLPDLRVFRAKHPNFFPPTDYDNAESSLAAAKAHFILKFKLWLRDLWKGGKGTSDNLDLMLGLRPYEEFSDETSDVHSPGLQMVRWENARAAANWKKGQFDYYPANDFQRALHLLFRKSWRARKCAHCGSYFVARKFGQMYCGTDCSEIVQRKARKEWWTKHGNTWRAKRKRRRKRL